MSTSIQETERQLRSARAVNRASLDQLHAQLTDPDVEPVIRCITRDGMVAAIEQHGEEMVFALARAAVCHIEHTHVIATFEAEIPL